MSFHETTAPTTANRYVEEAKRYIDTNFYREITVTEIADSVGINDRYLYNLFMKYENLSPKKYLNSIRLNRAKYMLKNTDAAISEIAVSIGFSDVLTFSRFFSKNIRLSPTEYRKNKKP